MKDEGDVRRSKQKLKVVSRINSSISSGWKERGLDTDEKGFQDLLFLWTSLAKKGLYVQSLKVGERMKDKIEG